MPRPPAPYVPSSDFASRQVIVVHLPERTPSVEPVTVAVTVFGREVLTNLKDQ